MLIKYYGREDLGLGKLVNKSDGSYVNDSNKKFTEEHSNNISKGKKGKYTGKNNPYYGKKHTKEIKKKMRGKRPHVKGKNSHKANILLDEYTGIYYFGYREACEAFDIKYSTLRGMLNGYFSNRANLIKV